MSKRPSYAQLRIFVALLLVVLGTLFLRVFSGTELGSVVGALVAAMVILLIRATQRRNKAALAEIGRRGPKYDARELLREQREQMLKRGRARETQEARK